MQICSGRFFVLKYDTLEHLLLLRSQLGHLPLLILQVLLSVMFHDMVEMDHVAGLDVSRRMRLKSPMTKRKLISVGPLCGIKRYLAKNKFLPAMSIADNIG